MLILQILEDAAFAAVAAIGFSSISNPPKKAFPICALLAAVGHSLRFVLMDVFNWNIVCAGFLAGLAMDWSYRKSGQFANAVGTHCIMEIGASSGIKPVNEILQFMKEHESEVAIDD